MKYVTIVTYARLGFCPLSFLKVISQKRVNLTSEYPSILQIINISDAGFLTLVGRRNGVVRGDIVCEDAVTAERIRARVAADDGGREVECTVMSACAEEAIVAVKF